MHPITRNRRADRLAQLRRNSPPSASKARQQRCAAKARKRAEKLSAEIARMEATCET